MRCIWGPGARGIWRHRGSHDGSEDLKQALLGHLHREFQEHLPLAGAGLGTVEEGDTPEGGRGEGRGQRGCFSLSPEASLPLPSFSFFLK